LVIARLCPFRLTGEHSLSNHEESSVFGICRDLMNPEFRQSGSAGCRRAAMMAPPL
jgi:hypothetical protein